MEKKIVFFDLDGTLLDENKQIVPSAKQAIRQLAVEGMMVAIATGRAPFMFTPFARELGIDSYVSFNGQYVVSGDEVLYKNPLEAERLAALEHTANANGHPMVFFDHLEMKANQADHQYVARSLADLKADYPPVDIDFSRSRDIYQALLFCTSEEEELYKGADSGLSLVRWHELSMDVVPAGGSKANGIERLLHHFGIKRENSYAFGDGLNDIEMLGFVGTGVAMGNAFPETKQAADFVTKDASEEGIVYGLKALKLLA
jgi:hypothetical protein